MITATITITDEQARALLSFVERSSGKTVKKTATMDDIVRVALVRVANDELIQQAAEAEAAMERAG